jgi:DNA (cytosine-5)-methyltransferase 1
MTHASLFSGIGGFDLAAQWMGWRNVFAVEINPFCRQVLSHHFPNTNIYEDIKTFDATPYAGTVDVLTGGFPCQPYSIAGQRFGKADERHLFPEMLRVIKELKPAWVVGENVRGLLSWNGGMVFDEVCADLESAGYEVLTFVIPAVGINAPHKRERVWFVAHANSTRQSCASFNRRVAETPIVGIGRIGGTELTPNTNSTPTSTALQAGGQELDVCGVGEQDAMYSDCRRLEERSERTSRESSKTESTKSPSFGSGWSNFPTQSPVRGRDDGIPSKLDGITIPRWCKESIHAYGNAVVPQVVYQIFKAIEAVA